MTHTQQMLWTPRVKSRPRVTKFGVYTEKAVLDAEKALADQWAGPKYEGPLSVMLTFTNDHINLTVIEVDDYGQRKLRGDIDNYVKLVLDGLNGVAWVDDKQIRGLSAWKA